MADRKHSIINLIQFVPQQSDAEVWMGTSKTTADKTQTAAVSEEGTYVKKFYESVINESKTLSGNAVNTRRKEQLRESKDDHQNSKVTKAKNCYPNLRGNHSMKTEPLGGDKTGFSETDDAKSQIMATESKFSPHILCPSQRQHSRLLQSAQVGDLEQVSELLEQDLDINHKDFYGWTPLMCAAKEGHEQVVMYLLTHGADHTLCNSNGQTALFLAKMFGHQLVVKTISDFSLGHQPVKTFSDFPLGSITSDNAENRMVNSRSFFCKTCKSEFSQSEKSSHETSTVHLFNLGHKPRGPSYLIPETNRGFQMLLKTGWEVDKGLGPKGEGSKYPVKTILKRDRKGLGGEVCVEKTAKITHFSPNDKSAILCHSKLPERKMTVKTAAKYAIKAKERKDRERERRLRLELSSGYE